MKELKKNSEIRQLSPSTHIIEYRGYTIFCDCGTYYLPQNPKKKFKNFNDAKSEIDLVTKDLEENIILIPRHLNHNK